MTKEMEVGLSIFLRSSKDFIVFSKKWLLIAKQRKYRTEDSWK